MKCVKCKVYTGAIDYVAAIYRLQPDLSMSIGPQGGDVPSTTVGRHVTRVIYEGYDRNYANDS